MADTFTGAAGVFATEIDNSGPSPTSAAGIGAGVIGTSDFGPAFVPVTVGNYAEFYNTFWRSRGRCK